MILFTLLSDTDREVISRMIPLIAQGDENALVSVYNTVGGRLLSVAMGVTRDIHLAEDAVSESFIKLVKNAGQFKGGNGYAWLCTIVKNTALNIIASRKHKCETNIDDFFNLTDNTDFASKSQTAILVDSALKKLTSEERLCIWLKYFNDYTVRCIADEIGKSKSTVQEIIKKAEQKLKKYIGNGN